MGVKASDGSGWSSENNPFGDNDNRDERIGSDDNGERGNLTDRNGNPQADFSKTPEKQAVAAVSLITVPAQLAMVEGTWGVTINTAPLTSSLTRLAGLLESSLPLAGRLTAIGALLAPSPIAIDTLDPAFREHQQQLANLVANQHLQSQTYSLTALPASIVTNTPISEISRQKTVPAKIVVDHVVLPQSSKVAPAMIKKSQNINVFQAKKTDRPDVYSVKIAPEKPPLQIELSDKRPSKSFKAPSYSDIKPQSVLPSTTTETYQGIVDFGGGHAPIYISISKKLTQEEEKQQAEMAKIDWEIHHPIEAAQLEYDAANKELVEAQKSYNLADSEQKQATKYFQIASKIDYPKEKAELANLVNQLNKLYDATTFVTGPQLNHFRNQILKLQPSYEDKKQKVTLYEKTKNKLDESNKKLGIALESKKKAEAKEKKAKDNKEKEERRKKPGIATGKGKKVGDKWLDDAGKNCGKRFTKTPNCVNNLILKIKEI